MIWTGEKFRELKAWLDVGNDVRELARHWRVPHTQVEEVARDLGWIESSPLAPLEETDER